jgi:hypothetical protein
VYVVDTVPVTVTDAPVVALKPVAGLHVKLSYPLVVLSIAVNTVFIESQKDIPLLDAMPIGGGVFTT